MANKPVILTGLRANNDLTLGNYFGGLLPIIDMAKNRSDEYQINLFVPDLHSFTTPIDHSDLQKQIWNNLRLFVAAGLPLDNNDVHLYRQSYVPAHSELTWLLDSFTSFGEMRRMTQFKEKSNINKITELLVNGVNTSRAELENNTKNVDLTNIENLHKAYSNDLQTLNNVIGIIDKYIEKSENLNATLGLFNYPVLMASDILLYNATYVPVGDDQTQHLEFTRDIAERMNGKFGELFTVPKAAKEQHEFFGKDQGLRIKDLADPTKKMSKSDESGKGVIFLSEDPEFAAGKIMRATTDDLANIKYDPQGQPGISNLIEILALTTGRTKAEVTGEWEGKSSYGDFKQTVADAVRAFLTDFQAKLALVSDEAISTKLESSEATANQIANETLARVQKAIGLR